MIYKNYWTLGGILAMILAVAAIFVATSVHANPLFFVPTTQFSAATTSPAYLSVGGTSTTTSFDSYATGQPLAINKGVLLIQNTASSTSSVLGIAVQYSQDNIDWYQDNLPIATTTALSNISTANTYTWTAQGTAVSLKAIALNFPTRYVRVVFTSTGAAGAVWWQFVPQREQNQ